MRVFVLNTGRCGSTTFIRACTHITNYSASHESRAGKLGAARFDYPDNHIEADNRLSWFLGTLDQKFGNNAIYIHLVGDRTKVVKSYSIRWRHPANIMAAFGRGIVMRDSKRIGDKEKCAIAEFYYDTVTDNIQYFLNNKPHVCTVRVSDFKSDFIKFWNIIGAEGNMQLALSELEIRYNSSNEYVQNTERTHKSRGILWRLLDTLRGK